MWYCAKQIAFNQISQSAVYKEDDVAVSLTCCGGSYGGGSEVLVVYNSSGGACREHSIQAITKDRDSAKGSKENT